MRGGHNIKSTSEKKITGTSRRGRDADRLENHTKNLTECPPAPRGWEGKHKKKWIEVGQKLVSLGVLADADLDALAAMVQLMVVSEDAHESVSEQGAVIWVESSNGTRPIQNPNFRVYLDAQKQLKPLLEQFGMTPKSRQGIKTEKHEDEDPVAKMLAARAMRGKVVDMGKTGT